MNATITILGCGSSGGVPRVGQGWGRCDPNQPRNRRRRCSILVERTSGSGKTQVLVDASPDLREQLLSVGVTSLDGVLLSHQHADHVHGIDDVRPLVMHNRKRISVWMDVVTAEAMHRRFGYCFTATPESNYPPILTEHRIEHHRFVEIDGAGGAIRTLPFPLRHGEIDALGFRFGDVAYTPDLNAIPPESVDALRGLDVWIVDALRTTPHPSHFSLQEALDWIEALKPGRAILTNLHTDLDYDTLKRDLPSNVEPAFDGMTIEFRIH